MGLLLEIYTLHKYYISANRMRHHFYKVLETSVDREEKCISEEHIIEARIYLAYWYSGLYVVYEGWKQLELIDPIIENLLSSPNLDLLRRYRNAQFHFQRDYTSEKESEFYIEAKNGVEWITTLNNEFGRFFMEIFQSENKIC